MGRPPRGKTRSWRPVSVLALAALALGSAAALGLYLYVERVLAPLVDGDPAGPFTSRVYASPKRLRPGETLTRNELLERLKRLGYRKTASAPAAAGEYRESEEELEVHLRGFEHPFVADTPARVSFEFAREALVSLRLASSSAPLLEAVLEGELLYELSGPGRIRRERLRANAVPKAMTAALVSAEDRRFFEHRGVDPRGIARAAWRNLRSRRYAEGASTLTQQLARGLFLGPEKRLSRKLREAFLALYLETRFTKDEILQLYLDNAYFGHQGTTGIVGLAAAAAHFFDRPPERLELHHCALLTGLLRAPNALNPFLNPRGALRRRNGVLALMRRAGAISPAEESRARRRPLGVTRSGQRSPAGADYFLAYLLRQFERRYGREALRTRGLTVHTTLDPWLQEQGRRAVLTAEHEAALVALDPRSGAIRVFIGGKDFAKSPYDRAALARRQPGSAFKPFVYGAALRPRPAPERSWTAASLLDDTTRSYRIEGGSWTPRNYDRSYAGQVRLGSALARSLNAATVYLAEQVGPREIIRYAQALGLRSRLKPELGLALGNSELGLLELTGAYCAFANGGFRVEPYAVDIAVDADRGVLEYHAPEPAPALSPGEAFLMTMLLREAVTEGTAAPLARFGLERISAGKTGTTNDGKDAWFIGYTPELAAGVWTGSDLPKPLGLSGAGDALPIWARFMQASAAAPDDGRPLWPRPEDVLELELDPESGLLARSGCPGRRTEFFLSGTAPSESCPLHAAGLAGWLRRLLRRAPAEPQRYQ